MKIDGMIGIIGAMDSEVELLKDSMSEVERHDVHGLVVWTGVLSGRNVALVKCGIGKVLAGRCVQMLVDLFDVKFVINTGIAGGVGFGLSIGDAVIASDLVQHDYDLTGFGYVKGCLADSGDKTQPTYINVIPEAAAAAMKAAEEVLGKEHVKLGRIASGDVFVYQQERRTEIRETFGALATEMEGAAIALVASSCGIPFQVIRIMSDLADGSAPERYEVFERQAADNCARVVMRFLELI